MKKILLFILSFSTFLGTAQPANDNCSGALPTIVNPQNDCSSVSFEDIFNASISGVTSSCGATTYNDIWFSFTATSTEVLALAGSNFSLPTSEMFIELFEGSCGSLTSIDCASNTDNDTFSGLTIGDTYYVRLFTSNITVPSSGYYYFLCLSEIFVAPTNDDCLNAITLTPTIEQQCSSTTYGWNNPYGTSSLPSCSGTGYVHSDVWYSFTAISETHFIDYDRILDELQTEVYSGSCGSFTIVSCENNYLQNLTIGDTYYIRVFTGENLFSYSYVDFNICITTPPECDPSVPSPSDFCGNATPINSFNVSYCGTTGGYSLDSLMYFGESDSSAIFCTNGATSASIENNSWYSFTAQEDSISIVYWMIDGDSLCEEYGMQYQLFAGDCSGLIELNSCVNPTEPAGGSGIFTASNLTPGEQYLLMIDGYRGALCNYQWAAEYGIVVLGVELSSFAATLQNREVKLEWETTSETNSDYFEIQKSTNGISWETLGQVKGQGSTSIPANYTFIDYDLPINQSYYRLKQFDYNGETQFSEVRIVRNNIDQTVFYPNPVDDLLSISTNDKYFDISLYDAKGVLLKNVTNEFVIDMSKYDSGSYIIVYSNNEKTTKHLIFKK